MRALITGVNGQDGSYMAELLLAHGYEVHGTVRRSSTPTTARINHLRGKIHLHYADLADAAGLVRLVLRVMPDEVYNLAAMSDVRVSFDTPHYAGLVTGLGALNVLEAVRLAAPTAKVYQAGSSEMFGTNPDVPTNEDSRFMPASPYAAAKTYAYHMAENYRDAYGLFVVNGILFNHESERRGIEFVTRKITRGIADIAAGRADTIKLGNVSAKRDWGYAPDYMVAAFAMLQAPEPNDYVVATGRTYAVTDFLDRAFDCAGLGSWHDRVEHDQDLERPTEVPLLLGDASKIRRELNWHPTVHFDELVERMVKHDLAAG